MYIERVTRVAYIKSLYASEVQSSFNKTYVRLSLYLNQMPRQLILLFISIFIFSCQTQQKFDKLKWAEVADLMTFPNRKYMIDDLTKNYELRGKKYDEIIELLNTPQGKGDNDLEIFYDVDVDYGSDIDPVSSKTLSIQFDKDSTVKMFEVKEWKK